MRFSVWKLPGRKTLVHEGGRLMLSAQGPWLPLRLALSPELAEGEPFDIVLPASAKVRALWPAITRLLIELRDPPRCAKPHRLRRPSREALMHMRTLQALDAEAAGATHREIASAIFGPDEVFQRWSTNSELRAQVRHLLRRGHRLRRAGYWELLGASAPVKEGDFRAPSDPP